MFIKPEKGRSVPDPARGDVLPEEGRNVDPSAYWYRRIADQDVVKFPPSNKEAGKK
jgi:hypothetical protein